MSRTGPGTATPQRRQLDAGLPDPGSADARRLPGMGWSVSSVSREGAVLELTLVRDYRGSGVPAQFGVDAPCLFELVFQNDDAACRLQGGAGVDQLPGAGGQA